MACESWPLLNQPSAPVAQPPRDLYSESSSYFAPARLSLLPFSIANTQSSANHLNTHFKNCKYEKYTYFNHTIWRCRCQCPIVHQPWPRVHANRKPQTSSRFPLSMFSLVAIMRSGSQSPFLQRQRLDQPGGVYPRSTHHRQWAVGTHAQAGHWTALPQGDTQFEPTILSPHSPLHLDRPTQSLRFDGNPWAHKV